MPGFKGKYNYSVDDKGRVSIPAKLRKNLSEAANNSFVATRGLDGCIFLYPSDVWEKRESDMAATLNVYVPENRMFMRLLLEYANDVGLDKQSRIMLPQELLTYAGITGSVLVVGLSDHIELWNPELYAQKVSIYESQYDEIALKAMVNR
jgi:MraZ protein